MWLLVRSSEKGELCFASKLFSYHYWINNLYKLIWTILLKIFWFFERHLVAEIKKQTHVKTRWLYIIWNNLIIISSSSRLFRYATDTLSNENDIVSEKLIWIKIKMETRNKFQQYLKFNRYNIWKIYFTKELPLEFTLFSSFLFPYVSFSK